MDKITRGLIIVNANGGKLATQGVNGGNGAFDYSQAIKPDWGHASTYARLGKNVIEMPIDPSSSIYSALAGSATGPGIYPKENSRSSFILLTDGKGYDAYIMTILADPSYLKNDQSKLAKNTYRKHDADFTGFVFYFTPKGQYSGGYEFKNGQLLTPAAQNTPSDGKTIQSAGTSNLKIAVAEPPSYDCTFYYMLTVDQYGNVIDQTFLYAECTPNPGTDPGSPGTGGPGGSPPVPPKCTPATGPGGDASVQSLIINVTTPPPGGDGGMPPPAPVPCNVTVPETGTAVDTAKDPCAQALSLANSTGFKALMTALNGDTGLNYEDAYTFDIDANGNVTSTAFQGQPDSSSIKLTFGGGPVDGYAHDHYAGDFPTFSPADIQQIYTMMQAGAMKNPATFTASVVTASGTSYIIKISNPSLFKTFGAANLVSGTPYKDFENYYVTSEKKYELLQNNQITSYELALLDDLQDSGLTVLKGNSNFTSWGTITYANNTETLTNCNTN